MSETELTPEEIIKELRSIGDAKSTMFISKLFTSDDRVRTSEQVLFEVEQALDEVFDGGEFHRVFDERPEVEIRSESKELFAIKPKNEAAKRMIQVINIMEPSPKNEEEANER